jgi:DNA-binding MarR family transcriptional regulator
MSYADHLAENRRLAVLKLLVEECGHLNDSVLELALREIGHRKNLDRAAVRQLVKDLEERGCVTVEMVRDVVMVAHITQRGRLAAAGDVSIGGIASPHGGI